MYASDYGYAVSDECTQTLDGYENDTCKNNNWLFIGIEWLLPQVASTSNEAFNLSSVGNVNYNTVSSNFLIVARPVLYLISSVQITGGDGTSSNPYTLGL